MSRSEIGWSPDWCGMMPRAPVTAISLLPRLDTNNVCWMGDETAQASIFRQK